MTLARLVWASDSELLDWIEKNHLTVVRECEFGQCSWKACQSYKDAYDLPRLRPVGIGDTLREAIQDSMPTPKQ